MGPAIQHWRTTLVGVLLIIGGLANAGAQLGQGHHVDLATLGGTLTAGYGFIKAADAKEVKG